MSDEAKKVIVEKLGPTVRKYFRMEEEPTTVSPPAKSTGFSQEEKEEQMIKIWFPEIATRLETLEIRLKKLENRPEPTCTCCNVIG